MFNWLIGEFTNNISLLMYLMILDYISAIILTFFFKNSNKTKNGKFSSKEATKGIIKKVAILFTCTVAHRIDVTFDLSVAFSATVIAFIVSESLSIVENLSRMGVKIPDVLKNIIEDLQKKE